MEFVKLFLVEVTEELLYNIVYEEDEIEYHDLSDKFELKTGDRPMDFFGFGNVTGQGWFDFIRTTPGLLLLDGMIYIYHGDDDDEEKKRVINFYKQNNSAYIDSIYNLQSVAEYRENILITSCKMIRANFPALGDCEDANGNTPLHLIAALPGQANDEPTLMKHLLRAGVDPLEPNNNGQNFLHIISGRFRGKLDENGEICFGNERVPLCLWHGSDRVCLLNFLFRELTSTQLASLAKAQDNSGNTVIHEWAISMLNVEDFHYEKPILELLLKFGASLRIQNNLGNVALHYAFNPEVFKILLQKGAVCRARNDRDETPVLSILKFSFSLCFAATLVDGHEELVVLGLTKTMTNKSIEGLVKLLRELASLISENEEVRKTFWIPEIEGNSAVHIILIAVRFGSYKHRLGELNLIINLQNTRMRTCLVELLSAILRYENTNEMKRQNNKGQSALHILLDMGDGNKNKIVNDEHILESLEILLKHDADVNAVDSAKRTPLDVTLKNYQRRPSLYQKCAQMLIKHGARRATETANASSSLPSLVQDISKLRLHNERRKLRSCPERHLGNARRLIDPNNKVTIVAKYRYSSQNPIGSGAFSSIFVAVKDENVDSKSGTIDCRAYALKRLEKAKMDPQEIKREITTLLSISGKCENIIKCYEAVEDEFFQYLCLDLMDGDLNEFVSNTSVNSVLKGNSGMGVQVTKEILNGIEYLHEKKLIHRDLKPGNILYTTDPTLHFKIADFGLTKDLSSFSTMTSTTGSGVAKTPGTRCWMAPELVNMKVREHTQQSDVFSLGVVLHFLLTLGKHPFSKETEEPAHVIETRIAKMQIHLHQALHPEAASFLHTILREDPKKRPPAKYLNQHPFLWSERKKIEFLKAVGDQPEAVNPTNYPNSALEQALQNTTVGRQVTRSSWDWKIEELYEEMTTAWKLKKYRTDKVIDFIRFIRNAYAHKQEIITDTGRA